MERKEFNTVEEAIEALNDIDSIDYSVGPVDEITERDLYNKLMINLMGTRKLTFTAEQRQAYKEALSKKGLLSYSNWKQRQPNSEEKLSWKDKDMDKKLDVPVNLFGNLLNADEKKFEYIKDIVCDEQKSYIGKKWLESNSEILSELEKEKNIQDILDESSQKRADFVTKELNKSKVEYKSEYTENTEKPKDNVQEGKEEPKENIVSFGEKYGTFRSHKEAIEALGRIPKISYRKNNIPDEMTQKKFYYDIFKVLLASSNLDSLNDELANEYVAAINNLGCKKSDVLKNIDALDSGIELPVKILQNMVKTKCSKKDREIQNKKVRNKFIELQKNIKNNEDLKKWIETTEMEISKQKEVDNKEEKDKKEKSLPVIPKKKSFLKRALINGTIAISAIGALFGIKARIKDAQDLQITGNEPIKEKDLSDEYDKDKKKEDEKLDKFLEEAGIEKDDFSGTLKESVNYYSDSAYQKAPESNENYNTVANDKAAEENNYNEQQERDAIQAKKEILEESLDVNLDFTSKENPTENVDEQTLTDKNDKTQVTIAIGDDGSIDEVQQQHETTSEDETPVTQEDGNDQTIPEEEYLDDREIIDYGVIPFDSEELFYDGNSIYHQLESETIDEGKEKQIEDDDYER